MAAVPNVTTGSSGGHVGDLPECSYAAAPHDWYVLYRFILDVIVVSCLIMVGFVGNTLSFVVLHKDKSWSTTHFLLQCLALADTLFLVGCILFQTLPHIFPYTGVFAEYYQHYPTIMLYLWPCGIMVQTARNWITVTVTVERFVAIRVPLKAPQICTLRNVRICVTVVVVFAVGFNVPRFFATEEYQCWDAGANATVVELVQRTDFLYATVYSVFLYYAFIGIGPLLILTVLNVQLMVIIRRSDRQRMRMGARGGGGGQSQRSDVNRMLIFVISVFIVCETPAAVYQVLAFTGQPWSEYVAPFTNMLVTLNSSVNFFVYCLAGTKFRRILKTMCGRRWRRLHRSNGESTFDRSCMTSSTQCSAKYTAARNHLSAGTVIESYA